MPENAVKEGEELKKQCEQLMARAEEREAELKVIKEHLLREIAGRKRLEKEMIEIGEREIRRIGYELHDGLGQILAGLSLKSHGLEKVLKEKKMREAEEAFSITSLIDRAKEHIRVLMQGNMLMEGDQDSIMLSLQELASRTARDFNLSCHFKAGRPVTIHDKTASIHLYRIAQESVTNACRHGNPAHIEIILAREKDRVILTVNDNGTGIPDEGERKKGLGLKIMQYRANMIGASLDVRSAVNGGTGVTCMFLDRSREED